MDGLKITHPYETSPEVARYQCEECGAWSRSDEGGGAIRHSKRCDSKPQPTPPPVTTVRESLREYRVEGYATHDRAEAHAMAGLPELSGSEKQVRWATEIRSRLAPQIEARIAALIEETAQAATTAALREDLEIATEELAYLRAFLACAQASLWIDHRQAQIRMLWTGRGRGTALRYGLPISSAVGY